MSTSSIEWETIPTLLLPYWKALPKAGVLICTEHRCCYTTSNYRRHLRERHGVKGTLLCAVNDWVTQQNLAEKVTLPLHHGPPIPGLQLSPGWACSVCDYSFSSKSGERVHRHCSKKHQLNSKSKRQEVGAVVQVSLQTICAKSPD